MNDLTTMVGFLAGFATTAANLPQVWKTYRNKSAEGLSFRMLLTLAIGVGLQPPWGTLTAINLDTGTFPGDAPWGIIRNWQPRV
jgi:uncharacterized protein with PQ loop repeat